MGEYGCVLIYVGMGFYSTPYSGVCLAWWLCEWGSVQWPRGLGNSQCSGDLAPGMHFTPRPRLRRGCLPPLMSLPAPRFTTAQPQMHVWHRSASPPCRGASLRTILFLLRRGDSARADRYRPAVDATPGERWEKRLASPDIAGVCYL